MNELLTSSCHSLQKTLKRVFISTPLGGSTEHAPFLGDLPTRRNILACPSISGASVRVNRKCQSYKPNQRETRFQLKYENTSIQYEQKNGFEGIWVREEGEKQRILWTVRACVWLLHMYTRSNKNYYYTLRLYYAHVKYVPSVRHKASLALAPSCVIGLFPGKEQRDINLYSISPHCLSQPYFYSLRHTQVRVGWQERKKSLQEECHETIRKEVKDFFPFKGETEQF